MIASQQPLLPLLVGAHSPLTFRLACVQSLGSVAEKFPNVKMPEAMQWLDTGEFLTEESFFRYRDETVESGEGGMVYVSATLMTVDYLVLSVRSGFLPDLNESTRPCCRAQVHSMPQDLVDWVSDRPLPRCHLA